MPFKSKAQQRFMFAKHPRIARRWADKQKKAQGRNSFKRMPERLTKESSPAAHLAHMATSFGGKSSSKSPAAKAVTPPKQKNLTSGLTPKTKVPEMKDIAKLSSAAPVMDEIAGRIMAFAFRDELDKIAAAKSGRK